MSEQSRAWLDRVAGERMEFDREFAEVVADSDLSNQQWGLVMTAADFRIERPEDPEAATLVPVTDSLPAVMEQVQNLDGGPAGLGSGDGSAGWIDAVSDRLGLGDGGDELTGETESLLEEYADGFQERLIAAGRWERVCEIAANSEPDPTEDDST